MTTPENTDPAPTTSGDCALREVIADALWDGTSPEATGYRLTRWETVEAAADAVLASMKEADYLVLRCPDRSHCYECGKYVQLAEGESQGRAGWVHYSCLAALDAPNSAS